jgi:hypothetical protein
MNVKTILINVLKEFGYPVFLQGSLNQNESYPDSFITFWTDYTADNSHYDDAVHSVDWSFSVIFYSKDANLVNEKPFEIRAALIEAGFIAQGKGQDIPSDEPTHTGWAMDFRYIEIQ